MHDITQFQKSITFYIKNFLVDFFDAGVDGNPLRLLDQPTWERI